MVKSIACSLKVKEKGIDDYGRFLFLFAFALLIFEYTLWTTMIPISSSVHNALRYFCVALLLVKIILFDSVSVKNILIITGMLAIGVFCMFATGTKEVLFWMVAIIAAKNVDFDRILKIWLAVSIAVIVSAIVLSLAGVIVDLQYSNPHKDFFERFSGEYRHALGIKHPTDFAAHVFNIMIVSFYLLRNKLKAWMILIGVLVAAIVFFFTSARLDVICMLGLCFWYLLFDVRKKHAKKFKITRVINPFCFAMPICAIVMTVFTFLFDPVTGKFSELNTMLSNRLKFGSQTIGEFGLAPFGVKARLIGFGGTTTTPEGYNFIDCSYLKIALLYGVVTVVVVLIIGTVICIRNRHNKYMLASMVFISISAMISHHLMELAYVVFFLALFAKTEKKEEIYNYESL